MLVADCCSLDLVSGEHFMGRTLGYPFGPCGLAIYQSAKLLASLIQAGSSMLHLLGLDQGAR